MCSICCNFYNDGVENGALFLRSGGTDNGFGLDWSCARNQKISLLAYFLVSWWSWGILPPRPSYHWDMILRV